MRFLIAVCALSAIPTLASDKYSVEIFRFEDKQITVTSPSQETALKSLAQELISHSDAFSDLAVEKVTSPPSKATSTDRKSEYKYVPRALKGSTEFIATMKDADGNRLFAQINVKLDLTYNPRNGELTRVKATAYPLAIGSEARGMECYHTLIQVQNFEGALVAEGRYSNDCTLFCQQINPGKW